MRTFLILMVTLFSLPAWAVDKATSTAHLAPKYQLLIEKIDAHLNTQRTMQTRFVQLDGQGGFVEGTLSWRKPDQARFEYDPPSPLLLIASGSFLIEVDFELEQVTHYPQIGSIADFLLGENMLQNPEIELLEVLEEANTFRIRLRERDEPENGEITLIFDATSYDLRRWIVATPDRSTTTVTLVGATFNLPLEDDLFRFRPPKKWITPDR